MDKSVKAQPRKRVAFHRGVRGKRAYTENLLPSPSAHAFQSRPDADFGATSTSFSNAKCASVGDVSISASDQGLLCSKIALLDRALNKKPIARGKLLDGKSRLYVRFDEKFQSEWSEQGRLRIIEKEYKLKFCSFSRRKHFLNGV